MSEFELLAPAIQNALKKKGILETTEPQEKAIPKILAGKNLLLIAPTGMGKTEAAILPIFHKFLEQKSEGISILYITPLRALNRDMLTRMEWFGQELGIKVAVRHGDTSQKERERQVKYPPDMLITTPETLQVMFTGRKLKQTLKNIRWVIVDEVHELATDERGAQLSIGLERLCTQVGREFQRIGLSATVGSPEEIGKFLVGVGRSVEIIKVPVAKRMKISVEYPKKKEEDDALAKKIHSEVVHASSIRRCRELIENHRSTLFFVNTRDTAEILAARYRLWDEKFGIGVHHGSLSKEIRIQMEDDFKRERLKALICTSSLELGIDVGSADFTLQFNSPRDVTRLVQRIGRAGHQIRGLSEGTIIATNPDEIAESLVIARKALKEELEKTKIRENPFAVLANQLVAICASEIQNDIEKTYEMIIRAYPFRNLEKQKYLELLELLKESKILRLDTKLFAKGRNCLKCFYDNISMIPDEKTYRILDITTRKQIGSLDESFVASYAEPYAPFIVAGRTWRIVEVKEDSVIVEPIKELGAIPSWVGEEIPVPFEVAQEVGNLRTEQNWDKYHTDSETINIIKEQFVRQKEKFPMPTERVITIESGKGLIIINACLGSKTNETLGRLLSSLLAAKIGESVGLQTDPYRVIFELPTKIDSKTIETLLLMTKPESVEQLLRIMLRNSSYIRWQFINVAKKFGIIEKGVDYRAININKLFDVFERTLVFEEVIEKVLWENMDVDKLKEVLRDIQTDKIKIEFSTLSPIGLAGYDLKRELMLPQRADHSILQAVKNRLLDEEIILYCTSCKRKRRMMVKNLPDKIKCEVCNSVLIAAIRPYDKRTLELILKKKLTKEEEKEVKRLYKNANLVLANGKKAVMALVGRGIGPDTAARILARLHENEDEFLRDILAAEINYARTKRFWD